MAYPDNFWKDFGARLRAQARTIPCTKCIAKVGEDCITTGGHTTPAPHTRRARVARSHLLREKKT